MPQDPSFYLKKIHRLNRALLISGALNISILALFSYWVARERPPTPYFELKPASFEQQQIPLADQRSCSERINELQLLSFEELVSKLSDGQHIENGYSERDLALSCLVAFHRFDINRALSIEPAQRRYLKWKNPVSGEIKALVIYPALTNHQFENILSFAKTETWPLTSEGLFFLLQKQKEKQNIDPSLVEAFILTPEFLTTELLFNRTGSTLSKQKLVEVVLEGNWDYLKTFVEQQKQLNDLSNARRQKFLLDYIDLKSQEAAYILLDMENEFAVKKLDDTQVIQVLQLLPVKTKESEQFALALLTSPRSTSVWQQASLRLYEYAGEPIPQDWNYQTSLSRFAPSYAEIIAPPIKPTPPPAIVATIKEPVKSTKVTKSANTTENTKAVSSKPQEIAAIKPSSKTVITQARPTAEIKKTAPKPVVQPYRLYIVQEGDSLWKISRRFGVDMEVLKERNELKTNAIKPGTVLKIP